MAAADTNGGSRSVFMYNNKKYAANPNKATQEIPQYPEEIT